MNNYIDVKVTVWNRLHFADESKMESIAELIRQDGIEEVMDEQLGFLESETLYDTEEQLSPDTNGQESTVEVYGNKGMIWENAKK